MQFTPTFVDLVRNYTQTQGTANFVLGAAVTGYRSFESAVQPGESFYYSAMGIQKPSEHEVGRGTLQQDGTISREAISGSLTQFSEGSKTVALIAAAEWYDRVEAVAAAPTSRIAATRTELQSLENRQLPVLLHESGREGMFLFDPSNRSLEVAADSRQGIYVAPGFDPSGASGAWVRRFDGPIRARWFGTAADGVTDDYAGIQAALALASTTGVRHVRLGHGTHAVAQSLAIPDGVMFEGHGRGSVLKAISSASPSPIKVTSGTGFTINNIKLTPFSAGTSRWAIFLDQCSNAKVERVWIEDQTDGSGVHLLDCDDCVVDNVRFNGGASRNGYCVWFAGCRRCTAVNSSAVDCNFGFVVIGQDVWPDSTRATADTFGNSIANCHVVGHTGHAFDVNGAVGTTVTGCTASDYAGVSTHMAFQVKGGSGGDSAGEATRCNVFSACTVRNCPSGFGGQSSANNVFEGCTANNVSRYGFLLNDVQKSRFVGCNVDECGVAGIWLGSGSSNNSFNGIGIETSTVTARGIVFDGTNPSNNSNNFDNVTTASSLAAFIDIAASNNNNRFGLGCRSFDQPIVDASGTAVWPLVVRTPQQNLNSVANSFGEYFHRGMHVAVARFVFVTSSIGSPQVMAGRHGAAAALAAAQPISGVAPSAVTLTLDSQLLDPASIISGTVSTAGTGGSGFFQFEGIPRL